MTPPFKNSLGVISRPAMNKITIPEISPICRTVSSNITSGFPSKIGNEPNAKGPKIIPASNSPKTAGSFNLLKSSANIFEQKVVLQVRLIRG